MRFTWGEPFWPLQTKKRSGFPRLDRDVRSDVLVVGAGVTGALIARELVRAGLDVVAVDAAEAASGSTAASTALLVYELDTPLYQLIKIAGERAAVRAYRLGVEAIDRFEQLVRELPDRCGFERKPCLYLASGPDHLADLKSEFEVRRRYGLPVEFLSESELVSRCSFCKPGAILSRDAAQVDPFCLTLAVLGDAHDRGVRVFEQTEIAAVEETSDGVRAQTRGGPAIRARDIVFAPGYQAGDTLAGAPVEKHITYVTVSEPIESFPGWPERRLIWETARPYLYLRTTSDGRAMIGGEDDRGVSAMDDPGRLAHKRQVLERRFHELFPAITFRPAGAWAGVFETTPDSLPYIGPHPSHRHASFALCYGGNGMTFAMIAAGIVRDLCLGKPNADAEIFRFDRGASGK